MYISFVNRSNGERDNYPNVVSLMRVGYNEVLFSFLDCYGSVDARRVKLDIEHEIEIYM